MKFFIVMLLMPLFSTAQVVDTLVKVQQKMDWPSIVKQHIDQVEKTGPDTAGLGKVMLNNMVYDIIFMHSEDPYALNKGLEYMRLLLGSNPNEDAWIDTYAGLLYKLGRKKEAIREERKALSIAERAKAEDRASIYAELIKKMEKGLPTWE